MAREVICTQVAIFVCQNRSLDWHSPASSFLGVVRSAMKTSYPQDPLREFMTTAKTEQRGAAV
jgi:hypothetical protein